MSAGCACCRAGSPCTQSLNEVFFDASAARHASVGDRAALVAALARSPSAVRSDGTPANASGYTPLHYASRHGDVRCVEVCVSAGCEIEAVTRVGRATALHKAASGGRAGACEALLRAGANAMARDIDGETALFKAAVNGDLKCVLVLINASKEAVRAKDGRGRTARDVAVSDAVRDALDAAVAADVVDE